MPLTVRVLGQETGHKSEFIIYHIAVLTAQFRVVYNDVTQKRTNVRDAQNIFRRS